MKKEVKEKEVVIEEKVEKKEYSLLNKILFIVGTVFLLIAFIFIAFNLYKYIKNEIRIKHLIENNSSIEILAVGDVMVHTPQLSAQRFNGEYSFDNNFTYVKDIISKSDIAIANLETTLAGPKYAYDGYPRFNTPDALVDALKNAGFDVINFCNNHSMDMGKEAFLRTLDVLKEKELPYIGARRSEDEKRYVVINKNNINIGICGYTYQIPYGSTPTLNGNVIPSDIVNLVNIFDYYNLDRDLEEIKKVIEEMKQESDLIIFVIHWGNEYEDEPNSYQERIATFLSENGVDVIFGSHPHITQKFVTIGNTKVFYSMGNFISNQRQEDMHRRDTEDGVILNVKFDRKFNRELDDYEIIYNKSQYVGTWVDKHYDNDIKKNVYEIVPLNYDEENDLVITTNEKFDNQKKGKLSYFDTKEIVDNSNIENLEEIKIYDKEDKE